MELLMNLLCVVREIFLNFISTVMGQDYHVIGKIRNDSETYFE